MIKSIKFTKIKSSPNVFISADKLFLSPNDYKKLPKRIKNQQTVWSMQ